MRLLILNQYGLPAGAPGITRHGDLGRVLVGRGHQVSVIASRFNYLTRQRDAGQTPRETLSGVDFRWLDTAAYADNDRRRVRSMVEYTLRAIFAGARGRPRPDVILASSPHLLTGLAGLLLAFRFRVPFVLEVRDLWPSVLVDLGAVRRGSLTHRALEGLERLLYRAARRIITVPPLAWRRVAEVGVDPARCVHVPNGAVLTDAPSEPLPEALRGILEAEADREIIMYTGAHGVSNGLQSVIEAASVLREQRPETYERIAFAFVGEGPQRAALARQATDAGHEHVHFHGPIPKGAVPAANERATGLIVQFADVPVYAYGISPNKLFDCMAAARPVLLGTRLEGTPVDEAGAGIRFEPGSPTALADAIHQLVAMPADQRAAMGRRGREAVERTYNVEAVAIRLEAALEEVIRESRER